MNKIVSLSTIAAWIVLAGCQEAVQKVDTSDVTDTLNAEVRKSPNDDRNYHYLTLENSLRVLLVSDRTTDKSAAALSVYRGSFHEPENKNGLAHFLEHMLFIQTEKYPEIDGFQTFVSANGGASNAYTAADHTNYFFDVRPDAFPEALDRWGHFFIDPIISADYASREKNAVHSEYQMQIKADNWRGFMVSKNALNPAHPGSRFTIGSLETLAGDIQADLLKFFDEAYSADQMGLVVLSNQSLDDLENLVRPIFGQIENKNLGTHTTTTPMYLKHQLPAMVDYQSQKQGANITYAFTIPTTRPHYRTKPEQYFANLIGHEGQGSLYQALSQRGWIESLSSGVSTYDDAQSVFNISIDLTPSGAKERDKVTDHLFQYIEMLQNSEPEEWLYDEQAIVAELEFRFQEKSRPTGFVYQMAPRLQHFPASDLLVSPYLMERFDAALIKQYLGYLNPKNVVIEYAAPDVETDSTEPWFGVPYKIERGPITRTATEVSFNLPPRNAFLPQDLLLKEADDKRIVLHNDIPGLKLWLDTDVSFGAPRANLRLQINVEGGFVSPAERGMAALYRRLVQDSLSELVYPAYLAGLSYRISVPDSGFEVAVDGYHDKQNELLREVLHALLHAELKADRFEFLKQALIKDWQNTRKERPYAQLMSTLQDTLRSGRWPREMLIESLDPVSLKDLTKWRNQVLAKVGVVGMIHGNVDTAGSEHLVKLLQDMLPLAETSVHKASARDIGQSALYEVTIDHDDSAIVLRVQDEDDSFESRARSMLGAQILRPEYFRELRTEQQLGYIVSANNQPVVRRSGLNFIVQSPAQSAAHLEKATLEFIDRFIPYFDAMQDDDFSQHKAGLIARLLEAPKNLAERSRLYWRDLTDGHITFDSRQQLAALVEALTKKEMATFFRDVRHKLDTQRLLIYSAGKFEDPPTEGKRLAHPTDSI